MWCLLLPVSVRLSDAAIAWFELVFGALFLLVGAGMLVKFWLVRNVFEIKARCVILPASIFLVRHGTVLISSFHTSNNTLFVLQLDHIVTCVIMSTLSAHLDLLRCWGTHGAHV